MKIALKKRFDKNSVSANLVYLAKRVLYEANFDHTIFT